MTRTWMDVNRRYEGEPAQRLLNTCNDTKYWNQTYGISKVDPGRWREAQKQEIEYSFLREDKPTQYFKYTAITKFIPPNLGKVVEIGAGPHPQILDLGKKYDHITLVDPLIENYLLLPSCQYSNGKLGDKTPNLICDSAETLMISDEYDTVLCLGCLEHVADATLVLYNMVNLVRTGGTIIIVERVFDGIKASEYYDRRRPIKLYKKVLDDWAEKLDVVKLQTHQNLHLFDTDMSVKTVLGIFRKPKYSR